MNAGTLSGITVLDTSSLAPGAYATSQLAQLGAQVIKIERPLSGDPIRALSQGKAGTDAFTAMNAGKRSVVIDLKTARGWEDFGKLVADADVVVSNYTPTTAERLGFSYGRVRSFREDIIMVSITGYSPEGPDADRPGHDLNFIAASGSLPLLQDGHPEAIPELPVSDALGGTSAAFAIAASLVRRLRTGAGEHVKLSLTDTLVHARVSFGMDAENGGPWNSGARPGYGLYGTLDGRWLAVGLEERHFWEPFCEAIGLDSLSSADPMGKSAEAENARTAIQKVLLERTAEEWERRLGELQLPVCRVDTAEEASLRSIASGSGAVRESSIPGARFLPGLPFLTATPQGGVEDYAPELGEGNETFLGAI